MRCYIKIFGMVSFALLSFSATAQRYFGIATSEWSATNSMYLNPASIAGSHEKVTVSLLSVGIGVDNNLGTFTKISNIGKINNNDTSNKSVTNGIFNNSGRANFSMLVPEAEIRGPGVLVAINNKMTVALSSRIRVVNQLNNFDQSLYTQVTNPSDTPKGDYGVSAQKFNWTADVWSELNLSFGMVVMDNDKGQIKVGATLRHMSGIAYLGLRSTKLDLKYYSGKDSFYAANTDLEFASNVVSANSAVFSGINSSGIFNNLFGSAQGGGFGGDLGVIYSRVLHYGTKAETNENGHKVSASASVMDIGAINYNHNNYTVDVTGSGYLSGNTIKNLNGNVDSIRAYMTKQGFNADTGNKATKVHMPTALILSGDYQVYHRFCVNLTYIANLVNRENFGNSVYNQFTVTPRYDAKAFTIGLPITYSSLAGNLKLGLGVRAGGFFFGSDDMLALLSSRQYGFSFYFGGYVPIYHKTHKKDDDPPVD